MKERIKLFCVLASIVAGTFVLVELVRLFMWLCCAAGIPM